MTGVTMACLVQHVEKERWPGDPGLTELARQQAMRTGRWLGGLGISALRASPVRRARQTADCIAVVTGLAAQPNARLRERLTWDGSLPSAAFLALWAHTAQDRDLVPAGGKSARQAAARLQAFLACMRGLPGPTAAVTHGGITIELPRDLAGDDALPLNAPDQASSRGRCRTSCDRAGTRWRSC